MSRIMRRGAWERVGRLNAVANTQNQEQRGRNSLWPVELNFEVFQ
jgi:hypothetical protein